MKRVLFILLALMLLMPCAQAEIVGRAGDDYIHQWIAPNGQPLYFVSREEAPYVRMVDVNFDGIEDVAVTTFVGASNFGAEFFVWQDGVYVPVAHSGADSLVNYELYPELGLVQTCEQESWVLSTMRLWRWNGAALEQVRVSSRTEMENWMTEGEVTTVVTDASRVRIRVWDEIRLTALTDGAMGPTLLFDTVVPVHDEAALDSAMREESILLWEGLTP